MATWLRSCPLVRFAVVLVDKKDTRLGRSSISGPPVRRLAATPRPQRLDLDVPVVVDRAPPRSDHPVLPCQLVDSATGSDADPKLWSKE